MILSIVIPVYNVEKYIEECLLSCIHQNIQSTKYEIIIVNDGTPDNSMSIVERIAKGHGNIHIVNQDNQGLSMARNNGFALAKGEYVWFVDSDDWIEENSLSSLIKYLNGDVDEVVIGAKRVSADGKKILYERNMYPNYHMQILDGKDCWRKNINQVSVAQLTIYRSGFLRENNLSFIRGIYHEDFEFCTKASYLSKRTLYLSVPYYYFRETPGSITHSVNPKKSYDYIIIAKSLRQFCLENVTEKDIVSKFHFYISMAINNGLNNIYKSLPEEIKRFESCLTNNKFLFDSLIRSRDVRYVFEGLLFKCIQRYVSIYKVIKEPLSLFTCN